MLQKPHRIFWTPFLFLVNIFIMIMVWFTVMVLDMKMVQKCQELSKITLCLQNIKWHCSLSKATFTQIVFLLLSFKTYFLGSRLVFFLNCGQSSFTYSANRKKRRILSRPNFHFPNIWIDHKQAWPWWRRTKHNSFVFYSQEFFTVANCHTMVEANWLYKLSYKGKFLN